MSRNYTLKPSPIATDAKVFIGIDVHKKSLTFAVMNLEGEIIERRTTEHEKKHVAALVRKLPGCESRAVFEAGPTGYKLYYWLKELGVDVKMVAPSLVPVQQGDKIKTDRRDAEKLAQLLRAGLLESIHVLTPEQYRHREVTRTREQIRDHRADLGRQIKSKLLLHGVEIPEEFNGKWTNAFVDWLESGPSDDEVLNGVIAALTGAWKDLKEREKELKRQLAELAEEHYQNACEQLRSVPGIGLIWAMTIILEVGSWERFHSGREFSAYTGLVPGAHNSGDTERSGPLLRMGNKRLRTALVEASWQLIKKDAQMRQFYEELKLKTRASSAIVAVARRLGLALRAMMRDGTLYEYEPLEQEAEHQEQAAAE